MFVVNVLYSLVTIVEGILLVVAYRMAKDQGAVIWPVFILLCMFIDFFILIGRQYQSHILQKNAKRKKNIEHQELNDELHEHKPRRRVPLPQQHSKGIITVLGSLMTVNIALKILFAIIMGFLVNGAMIYGTGVQQYDYNEKAISIRLPSGNNQTIHYACTGPKNDTFPVFLIETDYVHGYIDVLDLYQRIGGERRVCIWDKPGVGFLSSELNPDQTDESQYYHQLILGLGEEPPFAFIGWGKGGEFVYRYVLQYPNMIHSAVMLEAYPRDMEWQVLKLVNAWDDSTYNSFVDDEITKLTKFYSTMMGFAIPWGLSNRFVNVPSVNKTSLRTEIGWHYLVDRYYTSAHQVYLPNLRKPDSFMNRTTSTTFHIITCVKSDAQIIKLECGGIATSIECKKALAANKYRQQVKMNLVPLNGGLIYPNTHDDCSENYLVYDNPGWVDTALDEIYANVTIQG